MVGVLISFGILVALAVLFYSIVRAGSKCDKQLHDIAKKRFGLT